MAGKAANEKYHQMLRDIDKTAERRCVDDLRQLMSTPGGRRVMHWLMFDEDMGRLQHQSFTVMIGDKVKDGFCAALHSNLHEGARSFAIKLHTRLQDVAPRDIITMVAEHVHYLQEEIAVREQAEHNLEGEDS